LAQGYKYANVQKLCPQVKSNCILKGTWCT